MPAPQRRENTPVIQRLLDEPHRFDFVQAVRIALHWFSENGVPRETALVECLRFDNSLSLSFAASQIEALRAEADGVLETGAAMVQALRGEAGLQIRITPTFMGFLGANGALPLHYTERILAYQTSEKDEAPRAFFDMFSNRVLALFYQAWRMYRFEHAISDGDDTLLPLLLSLAGFQRGAEVNNSDGVCDEAIALYAGVLQQRPVSGAILGRVLSSYFGVAIDVEECVGHWNLKAPHEQSALGGANAILGENAMLGATSWRPDLRARLRLGPLDKAQFERFLPHSEGAVALKKMLSLFGEQTVAYEVMPILRGREVRQICLSGGAGEGARLGLDSFLVSGPGAGDRTDMRYDIRPMAPLPPLRPSKASR